MDIYYSVRRVYNVFLLSEQARDCEHNTCTHKYTPHLIYVGWIEHLWSYRTMTGSVRVTLALCCGCVSQLLFNWPCAGIHTYDLWYYLLQLTCFCQPKNIFDNTYYVHYELSTTVLPHRESVLKSKSYYFMGAKVSINDKVFIIINILWISIKEIKQRKTYTKLNALGFVIFESMLYIKRLQLVAL